MTDSDVYVSFELIEAIKSFPIQKEIKHCGSSITVSPFDFYTDCPDCRNKIKVRSFGTVAELEDVFDAVFKWLADPQAKQNFEKRQNEILQDRN